MLTSRRQALAVLLFWLAVIALYLPTLRGVFVYDSIAQVLYSDYIHTASNWADVLTLRVVGHDELDRNRPLLLASLMTDAAIWDRNPFGYRLTSVLLHALNAALLFVFLTVASQRGKSADGLPSSPTFVLFPTVLGALFFALHPLVIEAVAEPSNREDLLVLLPVLVGLLGIVSPIRSSWIVNALLAICGFFAVLAKESGIAAPFVFAVAAWLLGNFRRCLPGLVGGLFAAVGFLVASYLWRPAGSAILAHAPSPLANDIPSLLAVQLRIWALQFWQILWPWNLSVHYPPKAIAEISLPAAFTTVALVVLLAVLVWRMNRLAALGVAVYVLCLLPASNFAAQYHPIADRYLYVPLAGLGMVAAVLVQRLRIKYPSGFGGSALIAGLLFLLSLEYAANLRRQLIWQQPATLWSDALRQYPNMSQAQIGMANVYYRSGDFETARSAATEAVVSSRGVWADAWALRAICEWRTGAKEQAVQSLGQARKLSPVYCDEFSAAEAMILSPEQIAVYNEVRAASGDGSN